MAAFVRDRISLEEFARAEEIRLLREAGPLAPVPLGWETPPPCEHDWVDVTGFGSASRSMVCTRCGDFGWDV